MKRYLPMALLLPLLICGCTSVKLDYSALHDIHFSKGSTPSQYEIAFMGMASAWPAYDWRIQMRDEAGTNIYYLCVYSNWLNKKPKNSIRYDLKTGYATITLNMPDFRPRIDQLVIADSEGRHPIEYRDQEKQPQAK